MTHDQLRRTLQRREQRAIAWAIRTCAQAKDGRGRWRVEDALARELAAPGYPKAVDIATAAAARRLGAFIAGVRV